MTFFLCETSMSSDAVLKAAGLGRRGEGLADQGGESFAPWEELFHSSRFPPPDIGFPLSQADVGFGVNAVSRNDVSPGRFLAPSLPVLFRLISEPEITKCVFGQHHEDSATIAYWGFGDSVRLMQYCTATRERYGAFGPPVWTSQFLNLWKPLTDGLRERGISFVVDQDPVGNVQSVEPRGDRNASDQWRYFLTHTAPMVGAIDGTLWCSAESNQTIKAFADALANMPLEFGGQELAWSEAQERQLEGTFGLSRSGRRIHVNRIVMVQGLDRRTLWERGETLPTHSSIRLSEHPNLCYKRWSDSPDDKSDR